MTADQPVPAEVETMWRTVLTEGHRSRYAFLPSAPRCVACLQPLSGIGGRLLSLIGKGRSRMNPNLCNLCDDLLPHGGAEIDLAVLFADLRGSTAIAEKLGASAFAHTLNRFYKVSTEALLEHNAMIDKMVGDEVMALFIPSVCVSQHRRLAAEAALDLASRLRNELVEGAALPVGVGVHAGPAYVGKVGTAGVNDFTALGDTVNTAARLQAEAREGEVVVSQAIYEAAPEVFASAEQRSVVLRGKSEPLAIRVLTPTSA